MSVARYMAAGRIYIVHVSKLHREESPWTDAPLIVDKSFLITHALAGRRVPVKGYGTKALDWTHDDTVESRC